MTNTATPHSPLSRILIAKRLYLDRSLPLPHLGRIEARLHPEQSVHFDTNGFLHPQRHFGQQGGFAVQQR